ncbi:putative nuclear speckle splicing regulatory protein 1 like protein [Xylogone sp. PMI_703]|nr:putative nuclear speckle splicing regulatory protein 1 like protein [Xylogone sp. PMI_703]
MAGGLSYGLNFKKKDRGNKSSLGKKRAIFTGDDLDEDEAPLEAVGFEELGEIDLMSNIPKSSHAARETPKASQTSGKLEPKIGASKKGAATMYGDLSESFSSKKHAQTAEALDASIYEYDAVYDSLKPQKKTAVEDKERKPKYMSNLIAAAAIRKRDAAIAEEKKLAREREAEGDEFADKEKFVTSAYKKQQEENRRLEEEERLKEEEERKKNKNAGMTNFYKNMLERDEQRHVEVMKATEEAIKNGTAEESDIEKPKSEAELAREVSERTGEAIAINDEGQVVDKRQLLKGGLNIIPKAKGDIKTNASHTSTSAAHRDRSSGFVGSGGGKQAMRERQSRMLEAQLEQMTKRALEQEDDERQKIERASKSRKTEGEIMSAKERYLARKREAEEAKKIGG